MLWVVSSTAVPPPARRRWITPHVSLRLMSQGREDRGSLGTAGAAQRSTEAAQEVCPAALPPGVFSYLRV